MAVAATVDDAGSGGGTWNSDDEDVATVTHGSGCWGGPLWCVTLDVRVVTTGRSNWVGFPCTHSFK